MLTEKFDVGDQVSRRVGRQVNDRLGGVRCASSALPLIELHQQVPIGIEHPPGAIRHTAAGSTVQDHRRLAVGVPGRLPIDAMTVADVEHSIDERLGHRI